MKGIFISYRRSETGSHAAGRISKHISDRFGRDLVYFDIQDSRPGYDFDSAIDKALMQCHAFVIVIDEFWAGAQQLRRLHNPEDFVRREIMAALARDVFILPVIIDETELPLQTLLPECLRSLCRYQALQLRHTTFERDIDSLISALDEQYDELEALRHAMPCPHCHQAVKVVPGARLASCSSCGADIGVLRVVLREHGTTSANRELSRLLELASMDVSSERYDEAYDQYTRILNSYPDCWEALINKSICLFWIGTEDLGHLPEVFGLLDKSEQLSNGHPKVAATRRSFAFNLAAIAGAEEMVGSAITWSLDLFDFSKQLEPQDSERDEIVTDYIERCFTSIQERLNRLLLKDRKDFDPPLSEVLTLARLIKLGGSTDVIRLFILMAERKLQVSHPPGGLQEELKSSQKELLRSAPEMPPLRIVFPFFGEPRIEET